MKKAAVIHDLSGFGKCSLTAAIPVLSALGVQCCPVATAVLTGQTGYPCYHCTDLTAMLPDYIDAWGKNNAHFDAIYSGFLTGAEQISQVLDFIRQFREEHTLLLVDPVMGDDGNAYPFFTPGLLNGMKELTLEADVITPNLTEACLLADIPENALLHCRTNTDLLKLAEDVALRLQKKASHPQDVVITGVKCRDEKHPVIYNIAATANGIYRHESPFFDLSQHRRARKRSDQRSVPTQHGLHIHRSALRHRRCCKLQSLHGQTRAGAREILCWKCHLHAGNPRCDSLRCRSAFSAPDDASLWCNTGRH